MADRPVPPFVYLLCTDDSTADDLLVLLHGLADGRRALLAYSSLDRLVDLCGPGQRWTLARTEQLDEVYGPFDTLVLDEPPPATPATPTAPSGTAGTHAGGRGRTAPPPVVYLPVRDDGARVEVRPLRDGRPALLAYTALDRLAEGCGPQQPWVALPTASLGEVKQRQPYDVVVFDLHVPEQYRREGRIA